jgi:beta-xylosidase
MKNAGKRFSGNPILPGLGVCDPHVRIFGDTAYLYATHDKSPENEHYVMEDWWVWSSPNLVDWTHECTLRPEQTYIGAACTSCWATDMAERNGRYYWYFSECNKRTGVVVGETPTGPWHDPLGEPLVGDGVVSVGAYDPGIFIDDDGTPFLVFGVWDYYVARLNEDMISLAETPQKITIHNPEGPYGKGKTDDKPYLHKRAGIYYLSWGCFYGMAQSVYGPYDCRGSIILEENVAETHRYAENVITMDRHGSFFEWRGQWYYICNDMSQTGSSHFRDSSLCYVFYGSDCEIEPIRIDGTGVALAEADEGRKSQEKG